VGKPQDVPRVVNDTRKMVTALDLQDFFPGMDVLPPASTGDSAVGTPVPSKAPAPAPPKKK
ncbi:MAG TPA: hypothetical protein VF737_00595, partial [Gemmatimonadaceae bacterium]